MQKSIVIITANGQTETHQIETDDIDTIKEKQKDIVTITKKDKTTIEFKALKNTLQQISEFIFDEKKKFIDLTQDLQKNILVELCQTLPNIYNKYDNG